MHCLSTLCIGEKISANRFKIRDRRDVLEDGGCSRRSVSAHQRPRLLPATPQPQEGGKEGKRCIWYAETRGHEAGERTLHRRGHNAPPLGLTSSLANHTRGTSGWGLFQHANTATPSKVTRWEQFSLPSLVRMYKKK
ncbi:hypothetical protein E2C01_062464 [Portunus trituberculatus]|uniref:Uncharacterized protein n=1 Tax=Portunus trituberculatus TaxID=210409 RepID=A0A5B7HFD7_PORTR|nr:hypothetical protein [Portunus trituberculatus]